MPRIVSRILTHVAYPGAAVGSLVRVKSNAETSVSAEDAMALDADPNFQRHRAAGLIDILEDLPPTEAPPAPALDGGNTIDLRARLDGESNKAWKARLAKLDDEAAKADEQAAQDAEFLTAYNAMGDEEKTAMYATLNEHEKALVDNQPKA